MSPWFKVDDTFHSHPRRLEATRAALGLWVVAGSWCAQHLTDGLVPTNVVRALGWTLKDAESLVSCGLWRRDGKGYRFHDWHDYQPTRESILAEREAARERMRKLRKGDRSGEQQANNEDRSGEVREPRPGPARPDPAAGFLVTLVSRLAAGDAQGPPPAEVVASWQEIAGEYTDLEAEAAAYLSRFGDRPADDERGAWLGWLRKAAERNAPPPKPIGCPQCVRGWLPDHNGLPSEKPCRKCKPLRSVS